MSNPIEIQTAILSALTDIMYASAPSNFEDATCSFEYSAEEDGSWSVGSTFSYMLNGKRVSELLNDEPDDAATLVAKLHGAMRSHTGGEWRSISISLKNGARANANFEYD